MLHTPCNVIVLLFNCHIAVYYPTLSMKTACVRCCNNELLVRFTHLVANPAIHNRPTLNWNLLFFLLYDFPHVVSVPCPVTGSPFRKFQTVRALLTGGSHGQQMAWSFTTTSLLLCRVLDRLYTNVVSAGGGLSDMVTGLGKMNGNLLSIFYVSRCSLTFSYYQPFLQLYV